MRIGPILFKNTNGPIIRILRLGIWHTCRHCNQMPRAYDVEGAYEKWLQNILKCIRQSIIVSTTVDSRSRSLYAIAYPSVCLSVTFVRPTQPVKIFSNVSSLFGTLTIRWHPRKFFTEVVPREPFRWGGLNASAVAKYSDFWHIECYISETVQDKR